MSLTVKNLKNFIKELVPLTKKELPKFLCLTFMMFLITYIHNILKISKDTLIISHVGAENISALKMWLVAPSSVIFMLIYIRLTDFLSRSRLFHLLSWFLLSYFILFAWFLYPNRHALVINYFQNIASSGSSFRYLATIVANWHYSLFFLFSEMWITLMYTISVWEMTNHITSTQEAKRLYPIFGITGQSGLMMASILAKKFVVSETNWQLALNKTIASVAISGVLLSLTLIILGKIVGIQLLNNKESSTDSKTKPKTKPSIFSSLKCITTSKTVLLITSIIFCYSFTISLIEGLWKKSMGLNFAHNPNQIQYFIGNVDLYISLLSISFALIGSYLIKTIKWRTSMLITPITAIIVGSIFFIFMLKATKVSTTSSSLALTAAMYAGAIYVIVVRAIKHTLFDTTKEISYMSLDSDLKTKGKAAAEMIGARFGKGGSSFAQQILLMVCSGSTLLGLTPIFAVIYFIVMFCWLRSSYLLGSQKN